MPYITERMTFAGVMPETCSGQVHLCSKSCTLAWRSAAFLTYLDKDELECDGTLVAHLGESSDEECEQ